MQIYQYSFIVLSSGKYPHRGPVEIPRGTGLGLNWNFQGDGIANPKTLHGGFMDIFWNHAHILRHGS